MKFPYYCTLLTIGILIPTIFAQKTPELSISADLAASAFMNRCAGCHTLTGQKLTGPSLHTVKDWPVGDLKNAIKRMEKSTGPLNEPDIDRLAEFLRSPDASDKLKNEEVRVASQFATKLEPASAAKGRGLFTGSLPLKKGGLACSSCHRAEGDGGTLGPDLTLLSKKMSGTALVSAIEKSSFKIMEPHYRTHPISQQEARHLSEYLSTISSSSSNSPSSYSLLISVALSVAFMGGLSIFYRRAHRYSKDRLQRKRH